jgi:basic amino acid/polyamine antiporter, APA family
MAVGVGDAGSGGVRRRQRWCSCAKADFFPEESFSSWSAYGRALRSTGARLADRLTSRSLESTELHEVRARSGADMRRDLTWWDLVWFGVGAVIGAGIFVLTGQEARDAAGPAVVVSYVVSGVSAMLSVFCYTEFAVEIPVAGNDALSIACARLTRLHSLLCSHGMLSWFISFIASR